MTCMVHVLDVAITSALAIKPSTVYILRIENTQSHAKWHVRRCFSEFCDLRDKLLLVLDGAPASSGGGSGSNHSTPFSTPITPMQPISLTASSCPEPTDTESSTSSSPRSNPSMNMLLALPCSARFPHLFKQFPKRHLFMSRTRKVIEQRTNALNHFLQEAMQCLKEIKRQGQIALYFSLMTYLDVFLDCAKHNKTTSSVGSATSSSSRHAGTYLTDEPLTPTTAARRTAAMALLPGFHHHPLVPTNSFALLSVDEERDGPRRRVHDENALRRRQFEDFHHAHRFAQQQQHHSEESEDDDEEMRLLKKTASCVQTRELREMPTYYTGSHYGRLESSDDSVFSGGSTASASVAPALSRADAWAARVEIAGLYAVASDARASRRAQLQGRQEMHGHPHMAAPLEARRPSPVQKSSSARRLLQKRVGSERALFKTTDDCPAWA